MRSLVFMLYCRFISEIYIAPREEENRLSQIICRVWEDVCVFICVSVHLSMSVFLCLSMRIILNT